MGSTVTYMGTIHCCLCIQLGRMAATTRVIKTCQTCDAHADLVERCPTIADAVRELKHQKAIRGTAL